MGYGGTLDYCSRSCSTKNSTPKLENHSNWKGGISKRTSASTKASKTKVQMIGKCERCGSEEDLQGHHVKSYKDNPEQRSDLDNIKVLCTSCHALEHQLRRRSGMVIKCEICSTERYVRPWAIPTARYCSRKCQLEALHIQTRAQYP